MPDFALPDGSVPVLVTADAPELLRAAAQDLLDYTETHPAVPPRDIAAMLFRTRPARRYRALAMIPPAAGLAPALRAIAAGDDHEQVVYGPEPASAKRIGFVFPGQGSQRRGMGGLYYRLSPAYRAVADRCDAAFHRVFTWSPLSYVVDGTDEGAAGDDVTVVQPALFLHMVALAEMWRAAGVSPSATVGHSQGEIAAAYVSGVVSLHDAIRVVTLRARDVAKYAPTGYSMAVLGIDREECAALLARESGWAELSVVNSAHVLCVSGERETVLRLVETLTTAGKFAREIRVHYPAHTSIVSQFAREFRTMLGEDLDAPVFAPTEIDCIGATLGDRITPDLPVRDYWFWNLRNMVRFDLAIAAAAGRGVDTYIEVAEHPALMLAIGENLHEHVPEQRPAVLGTSRRSATDLREFTRNVAAIAVRDTNFRWDALDRAPEEPAGLPLPGFPHSPMARQTLWAQAGTTAPASTANREDGERGPAGGMPEPGAAAPQRLRETWIPLERRALRAPRDLIIVDPSDGSGGLAAALVAEAGRYGVRAEVTADVFGYGPEPVNATCVILVPPLPQVNGAGAVTQLAAWFGAHQWMPAAGVFAECWLVTTSGEQITADDVLPQLAHGALCAGFRAIAAERPGELLRHLDIEPTSVPAAVMGALHTADEPELAMRGAKTYAKRLAAAGKPVAALTTSDIHAVISGGTGKLGLEFCGHFARRGAARVTLLSRSGETSASSARLRQLRDLGTEITVLACDITDAEQVARVAAALEPVDVLIHAAVNYVDAELSDITGALVEKASAAKVNGLEELLEQLPFAPAGRAILCSSLAATLGGRGQILYAITNRMLDLIARHRRAAGLNCLSVQWGLWSVQGVLDDAGLARTAGAGAAAMTPAAALESGLWEDGDAIVAAADWAQLTEVLELVGHAPLLAGLELAAAPPAPVAPSTPAPQADSGGETIAEVVRRELNIVMGNDDARPIDANMPLVALGLDSLQALDFRKRIHAALGRDLPVAAVLGGASLTEVVRLMDGGSAKKELVGAIND